MSDLSAETKTVDNKYCVECGKLIRARAEICPLCGVRQPIVPATQAAGAAVKGGRSKTVAALLAILLGGLGLHKFYLGRIAMGVLYLVFCWTFIPALIGLIEGIVYLSMSEERFDREFNT